MNDFCECGHLHSEHWDTDGMGVPFPAMCQGLVMDEDRIKRCRCVNYRKVEL